MTKARRSDIVISNNTPKRVVYIANYRYRQDIVIRIISISKLYCSTFLVLVYAAVLSSYPYSCPVIPIPIPMLMLVVSHAHAVNAELIPKMVMPQNAPIMHKCFECVKSKLSANNCNATLAMMPAVTANIPP